MNSRFQNDSARTHFIQRGGPLPAIPHISGPPSIVSSRMTDIASNDGADDPNNPVHFPPADPTSTSRVSSHREVGRAAAFRSTVAPSPSPAGQRYSSHKNYLSETASSRQSAGAGSISSLIGRTSSLKKARSHVPSLTSHAFFHPLSSQKLQAQRSGQLRTPGLYHPPQESSTAVLAEYVAEEEEATSHPATPHHNVINNLSAISRFAGNLDHEGNPHLRPLPSLGTEATEHETLDRLAANTSPTHDPLAAGSVSERMRPLQRQQDDYGHREMEIAQNYMERADRPSPRRSTLSFRSSILLPNREQAKAASKRSMHGAEKLPSTASSPRMPPMSLQVPEQTQAPAKDKRAVRSSPAARVHEFFEGNTIFFLGGRFQNSRQRPINLVTLLAIVIPSLLFFVCSASWLWHNVSRALPIIAAYLFYICLSSFIHASVSDPGILPRNLHRFPAENLDDPLSVAPPTNDWALVKSADDSIAALEVPVKHCRTCNIWRPPRAHHCRLCDNCIETHDHHCVWINNCVGRRNYRYFFAFIVSGTLLALYVIISGLVQLLVYASRSNSSFGQAASQFRGVVALIPLCLLLGIYPAALTAYHVFLMARGETTREYLNSRHMPKSSRYRVFNQANWCKNWIVVLCRPRPPTYYRFKADYQPGDQRLGPSRRPRGKLDPNRGLELAPVKPVAAALCQPGPSADR